MDKLTATNVFPGLEKELEKGLLENSEFKQYKSGDLLIRTGQYMRSALLIVQGLLKVYREDDDGNEYFMYYLQPGQACALSLVYEVRHQPSAVMIKAVTDTEVLALPMKFVDQWMLQYKSWYQFVMENYRARFEELLATVDQIAFRGMDERLEFYLKKHRDTLKTNIISASHQEIATELNSSREVISRLLKKMEQRGKVKLHRNAVEIVELI